MSYINNTGLQTLWNRLIVVLGGKADRTSVYTKAEVDYLISTVSSGGGGGDTSSCVHLTGTESITGTKTFSYLKINNATASRLAQFNSSGYLGSGPSLSAYTNSNPTSNYSTVISSVEGSSVNTVNVILSAATVIDYVEAKIAKLVNDYGLY